MNKKIVGVIGADSMVGHYVQNSLIAVDFGVLAFSRSTRENNVAEHLQERVEWVKLSEPSTENSIPLTTDHRTKQIKRWICLAPIWVLIDYLPMLKTYGAERVVAISSTSRYTKMSSPDRSEQELARRIATSEAQLQQWALIESVQWVILQTTLIYDLGRDRNITEIARFINRFGFFPVLGKAKGLRQPIHARDVADACCRVLISNIAVNKSYVIAGAEELTYRAMVARVFSGFGKRPRIFSFPLWLFRLAVFILRLLPSTANLSPAMATRMNMDMIFDCRQAEKDFGITAKPFVLENITRKKLGL